MTDSVDLLGITMGLAGGLALFLYGMHTMSEALRAAAGDGLKTLLARLTSNRVSAAATGALVTAVIQSSSVTTVLVVGFISAGLMTLGQSVGIIMGANVGTTMTGQIVAFRVTEYAWLMVAVGFGLWSVPKRADLRHYGAMLMGLGLLFLGMDQMSAATYPLRSFQPFITLMARMDAPLLAIGVGAAFTALVQSSSATTGIVIMLASQGFLSLEGGIALAIGANVGTCFTAALSALGKPTEAVRAAAVHVIFNVLGALIWVGFIGPLADVARDVSPERADLEGVERLAEETPRQIANANTLFNVANTLLLIGFTGPIAGLAIRLVPERRSAGRDAVQPRYLDPIYLDTPALGIERVRLELVHMGERVLEMLDRAADAWSEGRGEEVAAVPTMDRDVDTLHRAILDYLRQLSLAELSTEDSRRLEVGYGISNHLESIGDLIANEIVPRGLGRLDRTVVTGPDEDALWTGTIDSLRATIRALDTEDAGLGQTVAHRKAELYGHADEAIRSLLRPAAVEGLDAAALSDRVDLIGQVKRLYYVVRKTAQLVQSWPGPSENGAESVSAAG